MNYNLKILFLGYVFDEKVKKILVEKDPKPQVQTINFSKKFYQSISNIFEFDYLSSLPCQDFPISKIFYVKKNNKNEVSYLNLPIIKYLSKFVNIILNSNLFYYDIIFIHGLDFSYVFSALFLKKRKAKIIIYIMDQPGVKQSNDSLFRIFLKKIYRKILFWIVEISADSVIGMSQHLIENYKSPKKYVIPGIVSSNKNKIKIPKNINNFVKYCYAGSLNKDYGIERLVNIFEKVDNSALYIAGSGELREMVEEISKINSNITYCGMLNNTELNELYDNCDVLINFRDPSTKLAKNSFPSKLFEYVEFKKPIVTTKIQAIPKNIEKYFFYVDFNFDNGLEFINNFSSRFNKEIIEKGKSNSLNITKLYDTKSTSTKFKKIIFKT
jgi:hypothetical protein